MIRGIIFDLDGLMINSENLFPQAWGRLLAPYGGQVTHEEYNQHLLGRDHEGEVQYIIDTNNLRLPFEEVSSSFWQHLLAEIETHGNPMPGLVPLLDDLAARGLPLGIASNSHSHYVREVIRILRVTKYFGEGIVAADEVDHPKPWPDVYLAVARCLGLKPADCLALEDSPVGVQSALSAGMPCVFIPNPNLEQDARQRVQGAYATFSSLDAFRANLDELLALTYQAGS